MSVIYGRPKGLNANQSIYCPGCTHGLEHKLVMEVLEELGVLDRTIGVTSVGCSGLMYRILNTEVRNSTDNEKYASVSGTTLSFSDKLGNGFTTAGGKTLYFPFMKQPPRR